ncbi:MAG: hypothetical protein HY687_05570 [Chloroflexi bacterium]|nr:hypothetical protein [Chloroflexota bacterium]
MPLPGIIKCRDCGHDFDPIGGPGQGLACPRCGSQAVERSALLFVVPGAKGLTSEDYYITLMEPCCQVGREWRLAETMAPDAPDTGS